MKVPPTPPGNSLAKLEAAILERDNIRKQIKVLDERELALRKFIAAQLFPKPKEGTNKIVRCGIEATLVHKINRKILPVELAQHTADLEKHGVPVAALVEYNPALVLSEYRLLIPTKRKLFDRVLSVSEGTPQLTINV
jgi:hypothetical protein